MRDIGHRIQHYRLSRYAPRHIPFLRRLAWAWPILLLWGAYVGFLGEHSLLRLWRLGRENQRMQSELASTRKELERLESRMSDPRIAAQQAEHDLREKSGWARKGEIIYRTEAEKPDSSAD